MDFWQIIMTPFSWLLRFFCYGLNNYAVGLFLFALVVKLILAPLQYKGKKSMIKMTIVSGQMEEIKKRCGQDKERYNREVQEFYAKNKINPMGGCGWSMLPMLILFPLYAIIRRPMKYMMRLPEKVVPAVAEKLGWTSTMGEVTMGHNEMYASAMMNEGNIGAARQAAEAAGVSSSGIFIVNFMFLGINLAAVPALQFWKSDLWLSGDRWGAIGLFLLPIISAVLSFVSSIVTTKTNAMNKEQEAQAKKSNRMMLVLMPLMSLWIGYNMPAGLCIYWIANSVLMMVQEIIFNKMLKKDYEAAQRELAEQQKKQKAEEKERRRAAAEKKAAALAAGKNKAKAMAKEEKKKGVDVSQSRVGIRTYARGRAYDPDRYPVTPYHDPDGKQKPREELTALTEEEKQILAESGVEIPDVSPEELAEIVAAQAEEAEQAAEAELDAAAEARQAGEPAGEAPAEEENNAEAPGEDEGENKE